ncbi:Beta-1,4 N-acetylgalactosaminyltransferase 2 [Triplophysa tibetana]|uniref:Beta-1,4 N-acetylgalactosaminyltransferase 2 n=1 Tax=Triplophysa tibetana TaxID=1572043 RepID=A0A5A9PS69_9TELE|nr:Beta-1,4 N-acetylgalactosaminyltransferase 2 [Triplophysa tibetana]
MYRNQRLLSVAVVLVPALLLTIYYAHENLWDKPSQQILSIVPFPKDNPPPCTCQKTEPAKQYVPEDEMEDLQKRRAEEYRQHQISIPSEDSEYRPCIKLLFLVSLKVGKGVLSVMDVQEGENVDGQNEANLTISSTSLEKLNDLLSRVTYTSTIYHIKTEDLSCFSFENYEVIFPIEIRRPSVPVLYDPGREINSLVTVLVKAFLRYKELKVLITSIRLNYPNLKIIIADDSHKPEKIVGDNIEHYIMPPAQGWFAGRNLAVSQVTTKYFLWVDDDFVFLNETRIESFVEIMEAAPELDVVGGEVDGNRFAFKLLYQEGNSDEGGCITRVRATHGPVPGLDKCFFVDGLVNYFMGRTDAVRRVGFDPFLKRVAHTEFFVDGLGSLLVATCEGLRIGHQERKTTYTSTYTDLTEQVGKDKCQYIFGTNGTPYLVSRHF